MHVFPTAELPIVTHLQLKGSLVVLIARSGQRQHRAKRTDVFEGSGQVSGFASRPPPRPQRTLDASEILMIQSPVVIYPCDLTKGCRFQNLFLVD
jgi:hypothetical protein